MLSWNPEVHYSRTCLDFCSSEFHAHAVSIRQSSALIPVEFHAHVVQEWGIRHLIVPQSNVWTPDITVFESTHQVNSSCPPKLPSSARVSCKSEL